MCTYIYLININVVRISWYRALSEHSAFIYYRGGSGSADGISWLEAYECIQKENKILIKEKRRHGQSTVKKKWKKNEKVSNHQKFSTLPNENKEGETETEEEAKETVRVTEESFVGNIEIVVIPHAYEFITIAKFRLRFAFATIFVVEVETRRGTLREWVSVRLGLWSIELWPLLSVLSASLHRVST